MAQVPIGRFVVVGASDAAAHRVALPAAGKLTAGYRRSGEQVRRQISTEEERETERWLWEVAIAGSPDTVAARIVGLTSLPKSSSVLTTASWGRFPREPVTSMKLPKPNSS